jgi:hypothetical protein
VPVLLDEDDAGRNVWADVRLAQDIDPKARRAGRSEKGRCCRKSLLGGNKQDFLKLLMGFVRSDVGDLIADVRQEGQLTVPNGVASA